MIGNKTIAPKNLRLPQTLAVVPAGSDPAVRAHWVHVIKRRVKAARDSVIVIIDAARGCYDRG